MSKLEELIQEYCPDGVEYKKLSSVASIDRGSRVVRKQLSDNNGIPVYQNSLTPLGMYDQSNSEANRTFVIIAGAAGEVGYSEVPFWAADDCLVINGCPNVDNRYLFHYVLMKRDYFKSRVRKASVPRLSRDVVDNLEVPLPALPVQREIVRILDSFTMYSAELAAELAARKAQYEYYCHELLAFDDSIQRLSLSEIAMGISSGKNKNRSEDGDYSVYGSTGIISKTNTPVYNWQQILVARVGANAGYVHIADGQYDVSDNTLMVDVKEKYSLKFVYYLLRNMNLNQYAKGGGQPLITAGDLKRLSLPIPKRDVQEKIVNVLDHFETICSDLSEGLPAEIEARQKQYEHYRDKLLTFKRKDQ